MFHGVLGRNAYVTGISLRKTFRNIRAGTRGFSRCLTVRLICPSRSTTNHISERITAKPKPKKNTRTAVFRDVIHARKSVIDLELFSIPHLRAYRPMAWRARPRAAFVLSLTWRFVTNVTVSSSFRVGEPRPGRGDHHRFPPACFLHLMGLLDRYIMIHVGDKPINAVVRRFANQVREALRERQ